MEVCCEDIAYKADALAEAPGADIGTNERGEKERAGMPLESGEDAREGGDGMYTIVCCV